MTRYCERIPRDRFLSLPQARTREGAERRVGVEIEFAGLTEEAAGRVVVQTLGGRLRDAAPYELLVEESALGPVKVYLDTAYRKGEHTALWDYGLKLGREVIPVEIVTTPQRVADLPHLEELRGALRAAGAVGSGAGWLFGFGLHLNIGVADTSPVALLRVLRAFTLVEDWLRLSPPIDSARRLLPFADPYSRRFLRLLLDLPEDIRLPELTGFYLRESPTRNHSLDLLPLLRHLAAREVDAALPGAARVGARPAWHYRLPDSRVDEPDWRIAFEWNRWVLVECVAADEALMRGLERAWRAFDGGLYPGRHAWRDRVDAMLVEHDPLGAV